MKKIRKYGNKPFKIGLLHGGPGAAGELKPVAEYLGNEFGVLELLQTEKSIEGQLNELFDQLESEADFPVTLVGYSWGAWLAFIFTSLHSNLIGKLILVSSGAFESKYNNDLTSLRFSRLEQDDRIEAEILLLKIKGGNTENFTLKRFGELMNLADSYDSFPINKNFLEIDIQIFQSVWPEASKLRETGELIAFANNIVCPVVAIHGDFDSHPLVGVEKPLSERLKNFKMIKLKNCGHTPWNERLARDVFYATLIKEISS
jgi:pimeloyl-ACP methyl ester carboxylesterase